MYRERGWPISLTLVLALVGPGRSWGGVVTAHTQVVNSTPGRWLPLEIGMPVTGWNNRIFWSEFPPLLEEQPLQFWQVTGPPDAGWDPSPEYGIISFDVTESGPVWLAVTTRWGGGGNSSGGWIPQLTSRDEFEADGWTEIATGLKAFDVSTKQTGLEYIVFERPSIAGESFTYRTEKYHAPRLLTTQFDPAVETSTLFYDDFESEPDPEEPRGYSPDYRDFRHWDVYGVGVDLVAGRFFPEQGIVVDLDGVSGSRLVTKQEFDLPIGTYALTFDLGGPLGGMPRDTVVVSLGESYTESFSIDRGAPFETIVREMTFTEPSSGKLSFSDLGADSNGALLDNVRLEKRVAAHLLAGDADQDLDFDQADIGIVALANKYLTGQPATWGEGDWDGAPGQHVGNPPPGDGVFDQMDIIAALTPAHYLTGTYAALQPNGVRNDIQLSIVYDASTGELTVDAPQGIGVTSINVDSAAGIFTGAPARNLGGSFDNDGDTNIFKAVFGSSFGSLSFGNVAQTGLSDAFLHGDLSVVGSVAGGGDLGHVDLIYVPEATTLALALVGLLIIVSRRWKWEAGKV